MVVVVLSSVHIAWASSRILVYLFYLFWRNTYGKLDNLVNLRPLENYAVYLPWYSGYRCELTLTNSKNPLVMVLGARCVGLHKLSNTLIQKSKILFLKQTFKCPRPGWSQILIPAKIRFDIYRLVRDVHDEAIVCFDASGLPLFVRPVKNRPAIQNSYVDGWIREYCHCHKQIGVVDLSWFLTNWEDFWS